MANRLTSLLAALLLASVAHGQVLLNKFGPVTGVLVGTAGDPATAAATIADLQPILSTTPGLVLNSATGGSKGAGTINATGLYVNGSAVGVGGGAVSSVGISVPTGGCFGTSGSPVTSSGTLGVTLSGTTSQYVDGTGGCQTTPVAANPTGHVGTTAANGSAVTFMRSDAAPAIDLTMSPTMTGTWTFTSSSAPQVSIIPAGGGAGALKVESGNTSTDAYILTTAQGAANWSFGAKTSTGFWELCAAATLTGTCPIQVSTAGSVTIPAGSATTVNLILDAVATNSVGAVQFFDTTNSVIRGYIGSGGVCTGQPVADLCIAPGASGSVDIGTANGDGVGTSFGPAGTVTINAPTSGSPVALKVQAANNNNAAAFTGGATSGQSFGLGIAAGTTSADHALLITNQTATTAYLELYGDGGVVVGAPSGGDKGVGSLNAVTLYVNGVAVGTGATVAVARWTGTCSSGGCTTGVASGFNTPTRSSAGVYNLTFNPAFGGNASCTASGYSTGSPLIPQVQSGFSTTSITLFNAAGVATDGDFSIVCIG